MECSLDLIRLIKQKPFFMVETHGREKMSKKLSKYISVLDFFNTSLLVLSKASETDFAASFATIIASICHWNS